jgi:3-oxoacyl-[acyl-carrier-protein] synthase-3
LPERVLTNADLERMVDTSDEWIVTRTGIRERRIVADDEATSDLAVRACEAAIVDAGIDRDDVDLLVLATSSPDMIFPSTAALTQHKLGIDCAAFDAMAACTGFVYALFSAVTAIESGRANTALVVGADAFTRFVDFEDRSTCVLFGDGAGAVVLTSSETSSVLHIDLGADGGGAGILSVPAGGSAAPCTAERCERGEQYVRMSGNEVFKFVVRAIPQTTRRALEASGLGVDDVRWVVPHQANQRILDTIADRLHVPHERVCSTIETTGNTSTASIPLALDHLYTSGDLAPGDVVALVGFGAGLTWGTAVLRWTKEAP